MNRNRLSFFTLLLLLLATVTVVQAGGQADLATVRAATAPFHQVDVAMTAGWNFVASGCVENPGVGGMGYHYVNGALVDLTVEASRPEVLVYAPGPDGQLQLAAAEYMVPAAPWDAVNPNPPSVLGQTMHLNPILGAYVLHAWVWRNNPAGMFAEWNPSVSCS
jgi:hypothetical protein